MSFFATIRGWTGFLIAGLFFASALFSCTLQKSPITGKKRAYGYSWEEELKIGKEVHQSIQQHYGIYENPEVVNYVKEVGRRVLEESHMRRSSTPEKYRKTEFTFSVLDSPVVNAFALPGGYVYVTRGLLAHLNNEAQLAVVLGHEIGHVVARHASQRAFEQKVGQIALVGGAVVGQEVFGMPGRDLLELGGTAAQLLFLRYSRDDERESDQLGVEYAAMAGYEASEGADFFTALRRITEKSGETLPSLLSTHPDPGDRETKIPELAARWRNKGYKMNTVREKIYLNRLEGIVFGDNPRKGFVREGVFYHPDLEFQFPVPEHWNVNNQRNSVILVENDERALIQFTIDSEAGSPRESVVNIITKQDIDVIDHGDAVNKGNLDAYRATARVETREGTIKLYGYAVEYGKNIYRYLGYSTLSEFERYQSAFRTTTEEFEPLKDSNILTVKPVKLEITQANSTSVFHSLIPENLPMNLEADEIAIINQVQLESNIEKGTWLKIPVQ